MLYANTSLGKEKAHPKQRGICPFCYNSVIAKCGKINIWHWAHEVNSDCDIWSDGETEWHLQWKREFPQSKIEVVLVRGKEKHIADVQLDGGLVIEFQHSPLSVQDIQEREHFYGNMVWVFDISSSMKKEYYYDVEIHTARFNIRDKDGYKTFRWKHPKKSIAYTTCPTYLDLGNGNLFHLKKMHKETPCGGWGYLISKSTFLKNYK